MSMTGMDSSLVEKPDDQASVYHCTICRYDTQQKAQAFTHVQRVHLGTCLLCCLCDYHTYRGVNMSSHLNKKHADQEDDWVEPLPDVNLSTSSEVHCHWLRAVKEEPIVLDDV